MLLRQRSGQHMVEVANIGDLTNLYVENVIGRFQEGEEQQDSELFNKHDLVFLSGEELPRCWTDPHYRESH